MLGHLHGITVIGQGGEGVQLRTQPHGQRILGGMDVQPGDHRIRHRQRGRRLEGDAVEGAAGLNVRLPDRHPGGEALVAGLVADQGAALVTAAPLQACGLGHVSRLAVGEGGDGHEGLVQSHRHPGRDRGQLQLCHIGIDHLHPGGGAMRLTIDCARAGQGGRARADPRGEALLIHPDHGGVAAAPDKVGMPGHILHGAIIPGRLCLELLLDANGHPDLFRTNPQRGEGGTLPRCALLVITATPQQRQRCQSCYQPLAHCHAHFSLNHSLARCA
ncbi:hypothetical protein D3C73_981510 [compost metagenome]